MHESWIRIRLDSHASQAEIACFDKPWPAPEEQTTSIRIVALDSGGTQSLVHMLQPEAGATPQKGGEAIFRLLSKAGATDFLHSRHKQAGTDGLRLYLDLDQNAQQIPWELIFFPNANDSRIGSFMALDPTVSIVRVHKGKPQEMKDSLIRILIVTGEQVLETDPAGQPISFADEDVVAIERSFQGTNRSVHIDVLHSPSGQEALKERLKILKPHVLHFIGHGMASVRTNRPALQFTGWDWDIQDIGQDLLQVGNDLRLVVLNACKGAVGLGADIPSVARVFEALGVPAVVASLSDVKVACAIQFSTAFYQTLASGKLVDEALHNARNRLSDKARLNSFDWTLPTLSVSIPPEKILSIPEYPDDWKRCSLGKEVRNGFVDRCEERRMLLHSLKPLSPAPSPNRVLLLRGTEQAGKSWAIKRCLAELCLLGLNIRYCQIYTAETTDYLSVLSAIRAGDPKTKSPACARLPDQYFEKFDQALQAFRNQIAESGYNRISEGTITDLFEKMREGLKKTAQNQGGLVLVLDHFRVPGKGGLPEPQFTQYVLPQLIQPALEGELPDVQFVIVMRDAESRDYSLTDEQDKPRFENLGGIPIPEFKKEDAERIFLEFCRYRKNAKLKSIYSLFHSIILENQPSWRPSLLQKLEVFVQPALQAVDEEN
jgi:hypothetical protein